MTPRTVFRWRMIERIVIILASTTPLWGGLWLFTRVESTNVSVSFYGFVMNGQGPGLAFMAATVWLLSRCQKIPIDVTIRYEPAAGGGGASRVVILGQPEPPPGEPK